MKKLILALLLTLFATAAQAQTCPTRPFGDSSNACASTAFVQNALAATVTSVTNADGSLTISPTTGSVVASLNVGHVNRWSVDQFFGSGNPWIDVKSGAHGCAIAAGDGTTNDVAAIQCYIDWAYANINGHAGVINLGPSLYHVATPGVVVKGAVVLQGAGKGSGGLSANTDTTVVTFDSTTCLYGSAMNDLGVLGWQNPAATQDVVVIQTNCPTNISHAQIWGGRHALNTAGFDGTYWDIYPCGWSGNNVFSTGANWWFDIKADSCSGPSTGNGMEFAPTVFTENFIYRADISCGSCTNSIKIDDTTGTRAVTHFYGAISSKPIVISHALHTAFFGGEYGSTFSGAGNVSVVGIRGSGSTPTGTATYNCVANFGADCPMTQVTANITNLNATNIGAFTLTGNISGGGFQVNNVSIGNVSPSTATFTQVVINTALTDPLLVGGNGTTGTQLTFKTTIGVGTTDGFLWTRGNNGATTAMTLNNTGLSVGAVAPTFRGNISNNTAALPSNPGGVGADIVLGIASADAGSNRLSIFSAGTGALSSVSYFTSRGTLASPTANQSGDFLGSNFWEGYNGSAYTPGAGFIVTTTQIWSGTVSGTKLDIYTTPTGTTGVAVAATFDPSGGLSIGTATDPGIGSLQLNGQIFMPNITTSSAAQTGTVCWTTGTGKFTVDTTVGCLTSIGIAKNIISNIQPQAALSIIEALLPVSFRYKDGWGDNGQYEQFGFIAEQAASIDERLVGRDSEGRLHGVRYMELTAVLTAAIQELKAANDNIRAELGELKKRTAR